MKEIRANSNGFTVTFTRPVDRALGADPAMYALSSFIYKYHSTYGSPAVDIEAPEVTGAQVSDDGLTVELTVSGLRPYHVHEFKLGALTSEDGMPLLHDLAYYTLNHIPDGETAAAMGGEGDGAVDGAGGTAEAKRVTERPADWNSGPDVAIQLGTVPGLRFDTQAFDVQAGARVALTFSNNDDMLHNVVITSPGDVDDVANAAMQLGIRGQAMDYIPESGSVLFHTSLLQPGTDQTIYFTAPAAPGSYPFVCTFPGHSMTMRGVLQVSDAPPS
jgi:azurin